MEQECSLGWSYARGDRATTDKKREACSIAKSTNLHYNRKNKSIWRNMKTLWSWFHASGTRTRISFNLGSKIHTSILLVSLTNQTSISRRRLFYLLVRSPCLSIHALPHKTSARLSCTKTRGSVSVSSLLSSIQGHVYGVTDDCMRILSGSACNKNMFCFDSGKLSQQTAYDLQMALVRSTPSFDWRHHRLISTCKRLLNDVISEL